MSRTPLLVIVDDEQNILHALARSLASQPYVIRCTTNPAEALDILRTEAVDILISDQRMPHICGMQLLTQAKQLSPATVRILLTGYSDFDIMVAAINEGLLFHYISKPWNDEQLKDVLRYALRWKQENDDKNYILQQRLSDIANWAQTVSHLQEQITDAHERMLHATLKIVELKDPFLYHHCVRTAMLSSQIAAQLPDYPAHEMTNLRIASLFHDIGKIAIKDEVFYSNNRFSTAEYSEMKRHPSVGYEILQTLGMPQTVQTIVHQHHERLDGSGYPHGLTKENIVLGAKILTVADVYDALTSDRLYRKGISHNEASRLISSELHSHYDPLIVDALLKLVANGYGTTPHSLYN